MTQIGRWLVLWPAALLTVLVTPLAHALFLDSGRTVQLTGKASTQASWRTAEPKGFTDPRVPVGNLVQSRHLIDLEVHHDLAGWLAENTNLALPLRDLGYRLRLKAAYEGVTDYGPSKLDPDENPGDESLELLEHKRIQHNAFPWNAYLDLGRGPVFFRVGRQDLSWGETDGFRLLDMIEPLDNRFGFPLVEDLDDRRIPLYMVRSTIELPWLNLGPFSNVLFEGYWVPGSIDNQESPLAPQASPFSINQPRPEALGASLEIRKPAKDLESSRGGGRLVAAILNRVTLALVHYYTFNDIPSGRIRIDPSGFNPENPGCNPTGTPFEQALCVRRVVLEVEVYPVQVSGLSLTTAVPYDPLSILRAEAALFHSERVEQEADLSAATLQSLFLQSLATNQSTTTSFRNRNVLRWVIGLDRNVFIRPLNRTNTFFLSAQYFHSRVLDPAPDHVFPLIDPRRSDFDASPFPVVAFDRRHEDEVFFTLAFFTFYRNGVIQPFPIAAYDVRGVWALVPGVNLFIGTNWVLSLKYANVLGKWHALGFFRDRDVFFARIQYNLN